MSRERPRRSREEYYEAFKAGLEFPPVKVGYGMGLVGGALAGVVGKVTGSPEFGVGLAAGPIASSITAALIHGREIRRNLGSKK